MRTGFSGEIIRALGLVLMAALALRFYLPVGKWLQGTTGLEEELSNLVAFVAIAVVVYSLSMLVRGLVRRRMKKGSCVAAVEDVGGGIAGLVRMLVIMAWLSVMLTLTRSPVWHRQVAGGSLFGSFVVRQFPAVEAVAKKNFPEKMWFMQDLKRPKEPSVDQVESAK